LQSENYLDQFREAWTGKQDAYHREFFDIWHKWSSRVVDLDRANYPFYYPTAGASEPLRHIIFDHAAKGGTAIHVFEGEYEGYKAMGEAAGLHVIEHKREDFAGLDGPRYYGDFRNNQKTELFFISQPSAIDGNVWNDFNEFVATMPANSVIADITYVGAVPETSIKEKFNLNAKSIRNVVFSLSKPFGCYYDRIGGIFSREEDIGLFGNKWFKNLSSLSIGTELMKRHDVFFFPHHYQPEQNLLCRNASKNLGYKFVPSDVFILVTAETDDDSEMANYLRRAGRLRVCVTAGIAECIKNIARRGDGML
jgi:histidinol-phosphate/aromatic aminotransferase/cobyric acid decarboxylase-like protein